MKWFRNINLSRKWKKKSPEVHTYYIKCLWYDGKLFFYSRSCKSTRAKLNLPVPIHVEVTKTKLLYIVKKNWEKLLVIKFGQIILKLNYKTLWAILNLKVQKYTYGVSNFWIPLVSNF